MVSNCHVEPGMSGSMVLEESSEGKWKLVGLATSHKILRDGSRVAFAIYSRILTKFIDSVIGEGK